MQFNPLALLLIRFFGLTGDQLKTFVVPLIVFNASGSISISGLAYLAELLPRAILSPVMGSFADRFNLRKQLIFIDGVRTILILSAFFVSYHIKLLFILSGVVGFGSAYSFIILESITGKTLTGLNYSAFQARFQMLDPISRVIGPLLGAGLLFVFNIYYLLIVVSTLYGCNFILTLKTIKIENKTSDQLSSQKLNIWKDFLLGCKLTITHQQLFWLTLFGMLINFIFGVTQSVMPAVITKTFALNEKCYSVPNMVSGFAAILGILYAPKLCEKFGVNIIGHLGFALIFIAVFLLGNCLHFWMFSMGYAALILGVAFYNVYFRTKRVSAVPQSDYGKVVGASVFLLFSSLPLSGMLTYYLGTSFKPQTLINIATLVACAVALIIWMFRSSLGLQNNISSKILIKE